MPTRLEPSPDAILVRISRAARLLDCSRSHLYNLIAAGTVRSVTLGGSRRIPMSEIERLAAGDDAA